MASSTLDKSIFNPALYGNLRNVWFSDLKPSDREVNMDVLKKWFMGSPEERIAFDGVCRDNFARALEAIGPEQMPNPSAEPFLRQLQDVPQSEGDGSEAAWTALSMLLLLDQIPRNLYRTNEGLAKVYTHYDPLAYSLARTLLSPDSPVGRPDLHPQWRQSVFFRMWFYLPLMHSEDIEAHNLTDQIWAQLGKELDQEEGQEFMKGFLGQALKAEKDHREILDKFGRYPHRNRALGRKSTSEEEKFMAEGGASFGVAQGTS